MDNKQLVLDKITELKPMTDRMDVTAKKILLDPYEFTDWKEKVVKAISVTRNTPAWQAETMKNKLLKYEWQTKVESSLKLSTSKIADIERASDDIWAQVDEYLGDKEGMSGGLNSWLADHVVKRGPIGSRWWPYLKDGNLVIDCVPVDMRWCPFELNEWYCHITFRSEAWLRKEYGKKVEGKLGTPTGNTASNVTDSVTKEYETWDFWDKDKEEIYISREKIDDRKNEFKVPPFVIALPSSGSMMRDSGYIKYAFEDFSFLDRELYDKDNQLASIAQTLSLAALRPALEQVDKDTPVSTPVDIPAQIGETARATVPHTLIPRGDLNNAYLKAAQDLQQDINRGGVRDTESGDNADVGRTALYITTQNSLLQEKLLSRIDCIATFKMKSIRMIFDFISQLSKKNPKAREVEIGIRGMQHRYSAASLGDPSTYRITYEPHMASREQNMSNTMVGLSQRGWLPDEFILRDTMQMQDPKGIMRQMNMQKAREADPTIGWVEMAESYLEEAQELEGDEAEDKKLLSMMLIDNVVITRRARMAPTPSPQLPQAEAVKPNTGGLSALAGLAGGGGGARPQAQITAKAG